MKINGESQESDFVHSSKKWPSTNRSWLGSCSGPLSVQSFICVYLFLGREYCRIAQATPGYLWPMTMKSAAEVCCHLSITRCFIILKSIPFQPTIVIFPVLSPTMQLSRVIFFTVAWPNPPNMARIFQLLLLHLSYRVSGTILLKELMERVINSYILCPRG